MYLDSSQEISSFAAREETYGDIRGMVEGGYRGNLHDRPVIGNDRDSRENYIRAVWQRCKWKQSVSGRWMYGWYKGAPFSPPPPFPAPPTTSQLTCFSYFQDSRGEVKLALLPPCNLPLRHYHSTAAPMHLSREIPVIVFLRGISAHITKMLFACSETLTKFECNELSDCYTGEKGSHWNIFHRWIWSRRNTNYQLYY